MDFSKKTQFYLTYLFTHPFKDNNGYKSFNINKLPNEILLFIPTYDGFNQSVHPDVLFFPKTREGHHFYLVMTPYPWGKNRYENPSLLVSRDGTNFYELVKGLNPLVLAPPYGHNNDPDIIFNSITETFNIYYLETMPPDSQNVILLTSQDGMKWFKKSIIHYDLHSGDPLILSPAIIFVDDIFYMFYVRAWRASQTAINYITSTDGERWEKDSVNLVITNFPDQFAPWHLDVFQDENYFYMLVCGPYADLNLYLGRSVDLKYWAFLEEPIIKRSASFFDSERIYRSCGIIQDDILIVYFSIRTNQKSWQIGLKKFSLADLYQE